MRNVQDDFYSAFRIPHSAFNVAQGESACPDRDF